jgi:hypothetical protein
MAAKFAIAQISIALGAALALTFSATAFAQELDEAPSGFYADPVLPDPSPVPVHVFSPALATKDVAAVTPALDQVPQTGSSKSHNVKTPVHTTCTALNPCAISTPAAHG